MHRLAATRRPSLTQLSYGRLIRSRASARVPDVGNSPALGHCHTRRAPGARLGPTSPQTRNGSCSADLQAALEAGAELLDAGAEGSVAVEAAIKILEDSPHFNAGRGAALDEHGQARHDASIMRGNDLGAGGAVAGSSRIRNPIAAARAVMEDTQNVLLHGEGADWFAAEAGLETADPLYFVTEKRREGTPGTARERPGCRDGRHSS